MFIVEGVPGIIWAFIWRRLVEDKPKNAHWLSDLEKQNLEETLRREQEVIKPVKNYRAAFKSKIVILLSLQYAFWSIGVYGFVMWLPSIINSAPEMHIVRTGGLSSVPYMLAIIGKLIVSTFSAKTLTRTAFVWPTQ